MWYTATSATVTNGSDVVTINTGDDISIVQENSGLVFEDSSPVEVLKGYTDGGGNKIIQLARPWPYSTRTNQPLVAYPTDADFAAATKELRRVIDTLTVASTSEAQVGEDDQKIMTPLKTKESVDFRLDQRLQEVTDELAVVKATHPYPWAMRKVEFEARRAANNEKYAASGFVHKGKARSSASGGIAGDGLYSYIAAPVNTLRLGCSSEVSDAFGESKKSTSVISVAGVDNLLDSMSTAFSGYCFIKLPPAEDGTRTYDSATGVSITHATPAIAFASETATNKVVTDRVDMWGFEAFLREINDVDPFVYANGLIQSLVTDINGVPTVSDNIRPITYFAWYEGDTTSRGKGVNWQTATEAQRTAIASDPKNNIYFDDATGKFYQWSLRGRSFAGVGNGNWVGLDSTTEHGLQFGISDPTKAYIQPHGVSDDTLPFTSGFSGGGHVYASDFTIWSNLSVNDSGVFRGLRNTSGYTSKAINGECYFLVCGTVNRLNQGAYHPSHNPYGSNLIQDNSGNATAGRSWSEDRAKNITSKQDAFILSGSVSGLSWGNISSGLSGRPDGRYYDAIYASGQGGVCRDMRYSAWGLTQEDFAEADLAIKSGEFRGRETLKVTRFYSGNVGGNTTSGGWQLRSYDGSGTSSTGTNIALNTINPLFAESLKYGSFFSVTSGASSLVFQVSGVITTNVYSLIVIDEQGNFPVIPESSGQDSSNLSLLIDVKTETSVAGECTHTEVIGDPAKILLCDDLKDGWVGSWNPNIPDGVKDLFQLTLPYVGSGTDIQRTFTTDNGVTWSSSPILLSDPVLNSTQYSNMPANQVTLYQYKTKAGMTKNNVNSKPFAFTEGIGNILVSSRCREETARGLGFSLISKVLTSQNASLIGKDQEILKLKKLQFGDGFSAQIGVNTLVSEHEQISIVLPSNNSPAFKALNYNVVANQQGFINYAYTELTHNGTDWGDDSKIHIADNQTTMLDENGNTVLVGTAQIVEPLGWIKNDK